MQLIDEKGKVLGIINIVDLTVLLFILSTVTGFWWLLQTGNLLKDFSDFNPKKEVFFDVKTEVILTKRTPADVALLKSEIERLKETKNIPVRIFNITQIKPTLITQGSVQVEGKFFDAALFLNIRAKFDPLEKVYYYEGMRLDPGKEILINTGFFNKKGTIINVCQEPPAEAGGVK